MTEVSTQHNGASRPTERGAFAQTASMLIAAGYSPVPVIPGTKKSIKEWERFQTAHVTSEEIRAFVSSTPNYGVAVAGGFGGLVPLDIDTEDKDIFAAINSVLPECHVGKKGQHGFTAFYRSSDPKVLERGRRLKAKDRSPLVEVLSHNYTLIPPTIHNGTGKPYIWMNPENTLFNTRLEELTEFNYEDFEKLETVLAPWLAEKRPETNKSDHRPADAERLRAYGQSVLKKEADDLAAVTNGGRNIKLYHVVCRVGAYVHHALLSHAEVEAALLEACTKNGYIAEEGQHAFEATLDSGMRMAEGDTVPTIPDRNTKGSDSRPVIVVKGGALSGMAASAEKMLVASGAPVFQRGLRLVRPVHVSSMDSKGREVKSAALMEISDPYLRLILERNIEWMKFNKTENKMLPIHPPNDVVESMLASAGDWNFRHVSGVITVPTVRHDGSVLKAPGYDPATQLVLIEPLDVPGIKDNPTIDDAREGLHLLMDLLEEFPFVDDASLSTALSAIITSVVRGAFPVTPMHIATATTAGTGKSYLWDVLAAIATGRGSCPVMAAGRTEEETEKRLAAAMLAGASIINIDNVNGELGGDFLCQAIERAEPTIRILGRTEKVQLVNKATMLATGNNIRVMGDLTRRVLMCSMNAKMENPEFRKFKFNPVDKVLANRAAYVAAAINIVRAHCLSNDKPSLPTPLASFEGWSDMVRAPLIWLGCSDPNETMAKARADDPKRQTHHAIMLAWYEALGAGTKTSISAALLLSRLQTQDNSLTRMKQAFNTIDIRGLDGLTPKRLGTWLADNVGRIIGGLSLQRVVDRKGISQWYIEGQPS